MPNVVDFLMLVAMAVAQSCPGVQGFTSTGRGQDNYGLSLLRTRSYSRESLPGDNASREKKIAAGNAYGPHGLVTFHGLSYSASMVFYRRMALENVHMSTHDTPKTSKEYTPNQLQEALSKTFSVKKTKSKLRKAWDGSKLIYNVASWGATAIGIYQNPALLRAASVAFWTSCRVISKLL